MFSSITSYLFGAAEPETQNVETESIDETEEKNTHLQTQLAEEEWILVESSGASKMETSSMENLLIEHPSMSVYHHRGRQSSTGVESENSESSNDEDSGAQPSKCRLARHEPPRRPRALAARAGLVQAKNIQSMQTAHKHQQHKNLAQNQLRRSNRVQQTQGKVARRQIVQQPRPRMSSTAKKF